jgi:hypothetical protein
MKKKTILFLAFFLSFLFKFSLAQNQAQVTIYPSQGNFSLEDEISLTVLALPGQEKIDTVAGKISLENLNCLSVNLSQGIMAGKAPTCQDLSFILGIPQGTQDKKELFLIKVKGKEPGQARANLLISNVLSAGKEISFLTQSGEYSFLPKCTCGSWSEWKIGECNQGGCVDQRAKIRIRNCTPPGCDIESQVECIVDEACRPKPKAITILPPRNLSAKFLKEKNVIFLSWEASPTKDISGYFILKKAPSQKYFELIGSVSKNTLHFEDSKIEPGKIYSYIAVAFQGRSYENSIKSAFSNKVEVLVDNEEKTPEEKEVPKEENTFLVQTDEDGKLKEDLVLKFFGGKFEIEIPKGIVIFLNEEVARNQSFSFKVNFLEAIDNLFEKNPKLKKFAIKGTFYFIEGPKISFNKNEAKIKIALPEGIEDNAKIQGKVFENFWQNLPTLVDFQNKIATLQTSHFSIFGLFLKPNLEKLLTPKEVFLEPPLFYYLFPLILGSLSIFGFIFYYLWKKLKKSAKIEKKEIAPRIVDLRKIKNEIKK